MTFIVYGPEDNKILDVFPGCWDALDENENISFLWEFYAKYTGCSIVYAYCIHHNCESNYLYKPEWYTRQENR